MQSASEKKTETARREENARRRLFCYLLARLGNPREAAVGAGYPRGEAHLHAARLLGQKRVVRLVSHYARMDRGQRNWGQALQGLWRLAFGEVNDAVSLLMAGEEPVNVSGLDLFAVSEIRRPRGGGCEIKFHDRLAALRVLLELGADDPERGSLLGALEQSARALRGENHAV